MTAQGRLGEPTESENGQGPDNGSLFFGGATELLPFPLAFTPESYQAVLNFNQSHGQAIESLEEHVEVTIAAGNLLARTVSEYEARRQEHSRTSVPFVLGQVAVRPPDPELEELAYNVRVVHHAVAYHGGILPSFQSRAGEFATLLASELTDITASGKIRIGGRDYEVGHHRDDEGQDEIAGLVHVGWHKNALDRDVIFGKGSLNQRVIQTRYVGANAEAGRMAHNARQLRVATPEDWKLLLQGLTQANLFERYFQKNN